MKLETLTSVPSALIRRLDRDETIAFMMLLKKPDLIGSAEFIAANVDEDIRGEFFFGVMIKRLAAYTDAQYSLNTILYTAALSENVGAAVMWAYTIAEETRRNGLFDMQAFARAFPNGVPSSEGYHTYWVKQKGHNGVRDNWLDSKEAWV